VFYWGRPLVRERSLEWWDSLLLACTFMLSIFFRVRDGPLSYVRVDCDPGETPAFCGRLGRLVRSFFAPDCFFSVFLDVVGFCSDQFFVPSWYRQRLFLLPRLCATFRRVRTPRARCCPLVQPGSILSTGHRGPPSIVIGC